ncbi:regulator of telomere elongation helicase 1-like [Tubulanus polymorphus]|uniref:regulator of telomere elongation helicase 1-like n=1 Tax=Tubulanus polymorphus TaxID=672921 RepID=UPI003DA2941C
MPNVNVLGVNIEFPFDPYPCQVDYMTKVIQCLQKGDNGILESPTGTGKTLCLLCASLAWLSSKKAEIVARKGISWTDYDDPEQITGGAALLKGLSEATGGWDGKAQPKIIYASRTHTQLSQAMQELKRTAYNTFKACVIGSREQLCINPTVRQEQSNTAKVHMCRAKVAARTCFFYNTVEKAKDNFTDKVMDIEDLVKAGERHKTCPYYMTRELKADAEILFMPYNYLLDPKARRAHNIELQDNIIIFDEAHNLEKICEDSVSFDMKSYDLASAIEEIGELCNKLYDEKESGTTVEYSSDDAVMPDLELEECLRLKSIFMDLEKVLDAVNVPARTGLTKPGNYIFELFAQVGITYSTKNSTIELLDKILTYMTSETNHGFHRKGVGLSKICEVLRIVFVREPGESISVDRHQLEVSRPYRVHIALEEKNYKKKKDIVDIWASSSNKPTDKQGRTLSYWCFSPGHSMDDLKSHGVKCIILTSGTLSPMDSFSKEMGIPFPIQLENPHVIESHQTSISVISKGPDGTKLNSSYDNRSNEKYQQSLGNALVNFARLVPNGLLVFFPSYIVMATNIENWQKSNIWNRIVQYKPVFVEPKGKSDFQQAMESFYEKINDQSLNGAIFMAVCRGKVSEGLDFADINGRAVVITGLPFPPRMDPKVVLKMKFLDENKQQTRVDKIQRLSGQEWYRQQATRAVNQAIGRVIRHKQDYGAILLCDERFGGNQSRSQLPAWIRPSLKVYDSFGSILRDVATFFKNAEQTLPAPNPKKKKPTGSQSGFFMVSETYNKPRTCSSSITASSVEDHVSSLRQVHTKENIPYHLAEEDRMARLAIEYERTTQSKNEPIGKGLLNALEAHNSPPICNPDEPCCSTSSVAMSSDQAALEKRMEDRKRNKKIKIIKKGAFDAVESLPAESEKQNLPNQTDSQPVEPSSSLHQTIASYSTQVKQTLNPEAHKIFIKATRDYTKTSQLSPLIIVLRKVFVDANQPQLFKAFYCFVKTKDRQEFARYCFKLTGLDCGYKPEHSLSKRKLQSLSETKEEKRQKLDPINQMNSGTKSTISSQLDNQTHLNKGISTSVTSDKQVADDQQQTGYVCCKCQSVTDIPLKATCDHICCLPCWKIICKNDRQCPTCGFKVTRKKLQRLLFSKDSQNSVEMKSSGSQSSDNIQTSQSSDISSTGAE